MSASQNAMTPRRTLRGVLVRGCLTGLALVVACETFYSLLGRNFREVAPGLVYRCAQLSQRDLEHVIKTYGIRTVINLRGCCEPAPWYLDQCRTLSRLNVSHEDVGCSAGRLPSTHTIRELVKILEQTEYPILVHCHRGIDRTGLVVVLALLLRTDTGLEALSQLSVRYAHLPFGKTGNMDRFFQLYREWLAATHQPHSRDALRRWLTYEYCPGECRAKIELLEPGGSLIRLPRDTPAGMRIRCTNTSVKPWRFRPGTNAGIHALYLLHDEQGVFQETGRAGLFHATVWPGQSIELTLALPPLRPGHYSLRADLIDEQHATFFQAGSVPLLREIEVK
jgi:protein tyrosine phosphatase (PTP) superfamily phosphohydrolase (DUF442 family)